MDDESKTFVPHKNRDAVGVVTGHSCSVTRAIKEQERFGNRFYVLPGHGDRVNTSTPAHSIIQFATEHSDHHIVLVELTKEQLGLDPVCFYYFLYNVGQNSSGVQGAGSIVRIMALSLSQAVFKFAKFPGNDDYAKQLVTTLQWTSHAMRLVLQDQSEEYTAARDALYIALDTPGATDFLQNLCLVILSAGLGCTRLSKVDVLCRILSSVVRTRRDLSKEGINLLSPQGLNRILVFPVLLAIWHNVAITDAIRVVVDAFVAHCRDNDGDDLATLVHFMVKSMWPTLRTPDTFVCLLVGVMKTETEGRFLDSGVIRQHLTQDLVLSDTCTLHPLVVSPMYTVTHEALNRSPMVLDADGDTLVARCNRPSDWSIVVVDMRDIHRLQLWARYTPGSGGYPGMRIHSQRPRDTPKWRLGRAQNGVSSNGGTSDGYGPPNGDRPSLDLTQFTTMRKFGYVQRTGRGLVVNMKGWRHTLPLPCWRSNHALCVVFKGLDIKLVPEWHERGAPRHRSDTVTRDVVLSGLTFTDIVAGKVDNGTTLGEAVSMQLDE